MKRRKLINTQIFSNASSSLVRICYLTKRDPSILCRCIKGGILTIVLFKRFSVMTMSLDLLWNEQLCVMFIQRKVVRNYRQRRAAFSSLQRLLRSGKTICTVGPRFQQNVLFERDFWRYVCSPFGWV